MDYDVVIIGSGSAGLPAGMYASRYKIKNLVIGKEPGGALATSHQVENWPGVLSASGKEIMDNFAQHAINSGSEILQDTVSSITKTER
jgi:thioredoxin reductase (NADPH)